MNTGDIARTAPAQQGGANTLYLDAQVCRVRLLLHRRILWLRQHWQHDPLKDHRDVVLSDEHADRLLGGETPEVVERFYRESKHAAEIGRAVVEAERDLAERERAMSQRGAPPPLQTVTDLFGLDPFERDVLMLCLAPVLEPGIAQLYSYIQDDITCRQVTPYLAQTLLSTAGPDIAAARAHFSPSAPLRRYRLVNVEGGPSRALNIDERIADYLCGVQYIDERVADLLRPLPLAPLVSPARELADSLRDWARSLPTNQKLPVLDLAGEPGVGKSTLARALADRLGVPIARVDFRRLQGADYRSGLRLLEREAILGQLALYLDVTEVDRMDLPVVSLVNSVLDSVGTLVIVGSREPWQTERLSLVVHVDRPDAQGQLGLWRQALAGQDCSLNGNLEKIVQHFDFGPGAIARAAGAAHDFSRMRGSVGVITAGDIWESCRDAAAWRLSDLAQRLTPVYGWDDIVLPEDILRQLREIASQVANRYQVYENWGFAAKLGRGRGISALFAGPSGTGKTMAAEILANALRLDLYRIDLAGVVSKYIGETEKNLKKVFDAAEHSSSVLFFDEADALFGKRTDVKDSHDRYANIEVNYLLQRMDDYHGLAILATNRKADLDRAFLRRLRFLVDFPFPDADGRRRIWQKSFPVTASLGGLDYDRLARLEIAGGNIRNVVVNAAFLAAADKAPIEMRHLLHAARREYAKMDKMVAGIELGA